MGAFQTGGLFAELSPHDGFDFVSVQVDSPDSVVLGVNDQNALLIVDHQTFWTIEGCVEWVSTIARVAFFSCSSNMLQGVGLTIDAPNAVAFPQRDPDRLGIDRE